MERYWLPSSLPLKTPKYSQVQQKVHAPETLVSASLSSSEWSEVPLAPGQMQIKKVLMVSQGQSNFSNFSRTLFEVMSREVEMCRERDHPSLDGVDTVVFEAPLMELHGPVKTQFGYHLILVTDRNEPSA